MQRKFKVDDYIISVEEVSKNFVLPHLKVSSVKNVFTGLRERKKTKSSETQHALKNISFKVKKGEFFGIVGRNGSGKSTMLKMLAGIYQPSKGTIRVNGKLVPFIELGVGFNPELSGRDNVYLNGALFGFSKREVDNMYEEIVDFAELQNFMDQKLKNYSSGMQVRLAFSMATRSDADILLVDEVLAVGDADFQRKCFNHFKELKAKQRTVIFVSHDMEAIKEYCDRVLLIDDGFIKKEGNPLKVAQAYYQLFSENKDTDNEHKINRKFKESDILYKSVSTRIINKNSEKKEKIFINAEVKMENYVENLVYGFSISDATGKKILGTNTLIEEVNSVDFSKKKTKKITWTFPQILNDGKYQVNLAVTDRHGFIEYDSWEAAEEITIKKIKRTPYPVYPKIDFEIK